MSTNKKVITSTQLRRKLGLRQKTCWLFKRKVKKTMESSGDFPLFGMVEVVKTTVGSMKEGARMGKNGNKRLIVIAIEKKKKGVIRFYAEVIERASAENLGNLMKKAIDTKANIKTDEWCGYKPLKKDFENLNPIKLEKKGGKFPELHRVIINFKGWLGGLPHHLGDLQEYIKGYTYQFNRSFMNENIFENVVKRMELEKPRPYKIIIN